MTTAQEMQRLLDSFASETAILMRALYKNNNQMRRSRYFRHLVHCRRLSRSFVGDIKSFVNAAASPVGHQVTEPQVAKSVERMMLACKTAYASLHDQFTQGLLMPFIVVAMSCTARLFCLCEKIFNNLHLSSRNAVIVQEKSSEASLSSLPDLQSAGGRSGTEELIAKKTKKRKKRQNNAMDLGLSSPVVSPDDEKDTKRLNKIKSAHASNLIDDIFSLALQR